MIAGTFLLVMVGIGFKISAVPLHFWAPDVYEGAPTPVAGFLSTASKAAGFAVLMRVVLLVFYPTDMTMQAGDPTTSVTWGLVLAILATISMVVGNVLALTQKNIKRLLAYSSIAQAGYILIGVSSLSPLGFTGSTFYLISYLVTNLAAFGVVALVGRKLGSDDIAAYAGLSRRSPGLALVLLVALLSLGGIPPFGGFIGKVLVFASAINAANVWLAVVGVLNAVVGLYYYLTVLKVVYLYKPETDAEIKATVPWGVAIGACVVLVVLLGTLFGPWYSWSMQAIFGML
jgi:NADH-quinone oxidoreductase subunit N